MNAISGTRRAIKELADGTVRVQIDIDPQFRRQFFDLFPDIDMPVAITPLVAGFEKQAPEKPPRPKHERKLSEYAAMLCVHEDFRDFLGMMADRLHIDILVESDNDAAEVVRRICKVESRAEFDTDEAAAKRFHALREEFHEWGAK